MIEKLSFALGMSAILLVILAAMSTPEYVEIDGHLYVEEYSDADPTGLGRIGQERLVPVDEVDAPSQFWVFIDDHTAAFIFGGAAIIFGGMFLFPRLVQSSKRQK